MPDDRTLPPAAEAFIHRWFVCSSWQDQEQLRADLATLLETVRAEAGAWVPVTERLPPAGQRVLVFTRYGRVETAWCEPEGWVDEDAELLGSAVTAWMPLPEAPAEGGEDG